LQLRGEEAPPRIAENDKNVMGRSGLRSKWDSKVDACPGEILRGVISLKGNAMRLFVLVVAALTLYATSFAVTATVTEADMFGSPAQAAVAQRTISINPKTRWVTVERGDVVKFVANGQEFAWAFNGLASSFDLNRVAPSGVLDRNLKVYVWPNAEDLADK